VTNLSDSVTNLSKFTTILKIISFLVTQKYFDEIIQNELRKNSKIKCVDKVNSNCN